MLFVRYPEVGTLTDLDSLGGNVYANASGTELED